MDISARIIATTAAAAMLLSACGQRPEAERTVEAPTPAAASTDIAPVRHTAAPQAGVNVPPPNAQGDPACPTSYAWGADPRGVGILVTYWSQSDADVTVLVRTTTGVDRAQRDLLGPDMLRLFEFPDVDRSAVQEVLIMTNTQRCFVMADPATFP